MVEIVITLAAICEFHRNLPSCKVPMPLLDNVQLTYENDAVN